MAKTNANPVNAPVPPPQNMAEALAQLAAAEARITALANAAAANVRAFSATHVTGVSKKTGKPYTGIRLTGNFAPVYLSDTAAAEVAANAGLIAAALKAAPVVRP